MLIAEESDRKRREKQKKGYPPNWGGSYLNSDASGSCREAAELPTRPLSPSGGPSRTIRVFDGSVHAEGRSGDVEPRFVFSFQLARFFVSRLQIAAGIGAVLRRVWCGRGAPSSGQW